MIKNIEISPEIARLLQRQCREGQLSFSQQLARSIVEEVVMGEDPELELMVEPASALADNPALARAVAVNDVVINGKHVHVCVLDADNRISIPAALAHTRYLANGALVVKLNGAFGGAVVGHVSGQAINQLIDPSSSRDLELEFEPPLDFQFGRFAQALVFPSDSTTPTSLKAQDYISFLQEKGKLSLPMQRQVISALLEAAIRENVSFLCQSDNLAAILTDASLWNSRAEKLCQRLSGKFTSISSKQIKDAVLQVGGRLGGQVELAEFQKMLIGELTTVAISKTVSPQAQSQIKGLIDEVYGGASALKAVKLLIKNQLTIDLAEAIDRQRKGIIDLANATADEFGLAFKTLALQPAYATHSQKESIDLEVVNEALMLLEVAKLAEEMKGLEF